MSSVRQGLGILNASLEAHLHIPQPKEILIDDSSRFNLKTLHQRLLIAAVGCPPCPERLLRSAESSC